MKLFPHGLHLNRITEIPTRDQVIAFPRGQTMSCSLLHHSRGRKHLRHYLTRFSMKACHRPLQCSTLPPVKLSLPSIVKELLQESVIVGVQFHSVSCSHSIGTSPSRSCHSSRKTWYFNSTWNNSPAPFPCSFRTFFRLSLVQHRVQLLRSRSPTPGPQSPLGRSPAARSLPN